MLDKATFASHKENQWNLEENKPKGAGQSFVKFNRWVVDVIPRSLRLLWPHAVEYPFPIQDCMDLESMPVEKEGADWQ